ncbi:MAG TPA: hypothetical protein VJR95_00310, partial [Rhodanobacter sp.]|nr:hypothetical protein [Rhodanobacter sp.]
YERQVIDLVEAVLLAPRVGDIFQGAIVEANGAERDRGIGHAHAAAAHSGVVMLRDPAIEARVGSATPLPLGQEVMVRLAEADPLQRTVRFELVSANP